MHGWSSESGWQERDCADPTLRFPVHPSLLPDVGLDGNELLQRYAQVPGEFTAGVTIFGVQPSLSSLDLRLCFDDLGIWGFGVGVLCRNGSRVHLRLPHHTSSLLAVHGLGLITAAMRRTYRWRCVLHTDGLPAFPRRATPPLHTPFPLCAPDSLLWRCLALGTWNVEGLTSARKQLEIGGVLRQARQHIVAVQESHEAAASHIDVPGYRWFGSPRVGRRKGGVGFLVLNALLPEVEVCTGATHLESLWLCVAGHRGERSLYVGCVYMPPVAVAEEEQHWAALMEDILAFQEKGQVVVLGDFNARVGSAAVNLDVIGRFGETHANASGQRLIQLLHGTGMYALNGRAPCAQPAWTRCRMSRSEQSVLDYILVDTDCFATAPPLRVFQADLSDHYLVHVAMSRRARHIAVTPRIAGQRFRVRRLQDLHVREAYSVHLASQLPLFTQEMHRLSTTDDLRPAELTQAAVTLFEDTLLCSAREVLGLKKCVQGRRHAWWTPALRLLIDRRRAAYIEARRAQERGLETWPTLLDQWRALWTEVKAVVRTAKQKLWRDQMHSCNDLFKANDARSFWQLLRWRSSGACPPATANHVAMIRTPAGHNVCSDVGISSAFAHHYARLGEPSPSDTPNFDAQHMRHVQAQVAHYAVRSFDLGNADPTLDAVPSRDEIAGCVEKLRNHKAGTEEGIVNEMLKYGGPAILDMLAGLVETLWTTEMVPGHWRAGDIVNIFKKGDRKDPGNYRGITLLNVVGKLYTKVIDSRLSTWLDTHGRLHVCQAGFRRQRSCMDHVYSLSHILQERTRQGLPTWLFFRDAAKAFDTVWRDGLLHSLWDIGVRGRLWRILRNLYRENRSRVMVNGQKSDFFPIDQGVAQGDPLSPTLYAIFEDALLQELHAGHSMEGSLARGILALLYADDLVGIAFTADGLQSDIIDPCAEYACRHRYRANVPKCGVMVCGPDAVVQAQPARSFTWGQTEIPRVFQYRHLGVMITPDGRQDTHIKQIITQGNARVLQMGRLLRDKHLSVRVKRMLVLIALRPLLEYGAEVLVPTREHCRASESVQLKAARMILACPPRTSSDVTRADMGLQLLSSCRDVAKLKWQHRLQGLSADRLERVLYDRGLPAPAQSRGRHRRTWRRAVDSIWGTLPELDMQSLSLPSPEFTRGICGAVHDRDHAAFLVVLASRPDLDLYHRVYEGPGFRAYLQRSTGSHARQAALMRFQLRSGTSMLRQHDSRFRDQPSHDRQDRICPACEQPDSIESVQHVLLHCPVHERRRAALRAALAALPTAQAFPAALTDDEGVIAFLRDDFMGGAEAALKAADTFLHAVITFRNMCVEQFGA